MFITHYFVFILLSSPCVYFYITRKAATMKRARMRMERRRTLTWREKRRLTSPTLKSLRRKVKLSFT